MKIDLTKEQYKTLLKLIYCGEWMLNSYKINDDKIKNETDEFEQYVFSFAKEYGFDDWIEYDRESGKYFPTCLMEEELHDFVDKYNRQQRKK